MSAEVKYTKNTLALREMPETLKETHRGGVVRHSYIDHKALERNKYAPWGRGMASRLEGHVDIPKGSR